MLIEIWERLRGYDQWIATDAQVVTSNMKTTPHIQRNGEVTYTYSSGDKIVWNDLHGNPQTGQFKVPDDSPLYQMVGGETVSIKYNPENPSRFYYRDLLRTRIATVRKYALYMLAAWIVLGAWVALQHWLGS